MAEKTVFKNELGLVHCITGNGKGKTTSAVGMGLRAVGHGFRVCLIQFMKGGYYFGELLAAEKYFRRKLHYFEFGQSTPYADQIKKGVVKPSKDIFLPFENEVELYRKGLDFTRKIVQSKKYDMVILDELNVVLNMKFLDVKDVLELILSKPKNVELIITGRGAPDEIKDVADYVTEIRSVKHPYDTRKILGRRGVEY